MSDTTSSAATGKEAKQAKSGFEIAKLLLVGRAFFALIAIIVIFSILSPNYAAVGNFLIMSNHGAIFGLLAIGMVLVILNGGIDLSGGSVLGLSGVFCRLPDPGDRSSNGRMWPFTRRSGQSWCCPFALGAFVGAVNRVLIAYITVPAFVASRVSLCGRAVARCFMTNGLTYNTLSGYPELGNTGFEWLGFNRIAGIPIGVIVLTTVALSTGLLLSRTAFGRWLLLVRRQCARSRTGQYSSQASSGNCLPAVRCLRGHRGTCSQLTSAGPTAGTTCELTVIATVVIGGAALTSGRGNVRGTMLGGGAFVIGFLSDGLVIIGVSSYWQTVFTSPVKESFPSGLFQPQFPYKRE